MTSKPKVGNAIPPLSSEATTTDTLNVQRHSPEPSKAEPRSEFRSRPQKQTPGRSRFLKYPLRYILPKPPMSSDQNRPTEAGAAGQPAAAMADQPDTDDKTAPHAEQEHWSITDLPDILYTLRPGTENAKSRHRVHTNVGPVFGKMIRNLPVLPTRISSLVEGWRLETWMRLDRRVTPADIIDRVNPLFRFNITEYDVEHRRHLFRQSFHIAHWGNQKSMNEVCRMVKHTGRDPKLNSTRGLTPGLIVPAEGEAGGRIPLPPSPLPMHNFPGPEAIDPMNAPPGFLMPTNAPAKPKFPGQYVFSFKDCDDEADNPGPRTPMNHDNKALHHPELNILYESPPKAKLRATDQSSGEFSAAFMAQPHVSNLDRKRKAALDPEDIFSPSPRVKRERPYHETIPPFPEYPSSPIELASHEGPPARFFPEATEPAPDREMSLEEYLEQNKLGYLEYLNARYFDDMDFPLSPGMGAWI